MREPSGRPTFPADFVWGTATAAFQIEGAPRADGKGVSIWDRFTHTPGTIERGEDADIACDHYHRWREDVALMADLGLNAYRFSVAWTRVLPEGRGATNPTGLDFYDALVDGLLARGITPYVTLYHWDLPQALEERGGWRSRDTARAYADYAEVVARRLGDRVKHWITHNEPQVVTYLGHVTGEMAPGLRDLGVYATVAHHLLLSHGLAVPALRAVGGAQARVGITLNLTPLAPATERADDQEAMVLLDGVFNRWFLDPLFGRGYPADAVARLAPPEGLVQSGDQEAIAAPLDFLGINYYTQFHVRARPDAPEQLPEVVTETRPGLTTMGWRVVPEELYGLLVRVRDEYAPSRILITENGAAYPDTISADGMVHDPERTEYLQLHFEQATRAIASGVPLHGYFIWSLLDNFEWARGYGQRFGVYYTDYPTQRRILKDSGRYLALVTRSNGAPL